MAIDYMGAILSLAGFTLIILPINWVSVSFTLQVVPRRSKSRRVE